MLPPVGRVDLLPSVEMTVGLESPVLEAEILTSVGQAEVLPSGDQTGVLPSVDEVLLSPAWQVEIQATAGWNVVLPSGGRVEMVQEEPVRHASLPLITDGVDYWMDWCQVQTLAEGEPGESEPAFYCAAACLLPSGGRRMDEASLK